MRYEQLIDLTEKLILSFNPVTMTLDAHFEQFIKEHQNKLFETEIMFLKQVLNGVLRYEEFLKILTKVLFSTVTSNKNDQVLYHIFSYLIIFRLDELPFTEFRKMVISQDAVKMNVFLQFLFDIQNLDRLVRPEWNNLYDPDYISTTIIGGLESKFPLMRDLLQTISSKATGRKSELVASFEESQIDDSSEENDRKKSSTERPKKQTTVFIPFKLTEPKFREIPQPIAIPRGVKAKPVPKTINKVTLNQIDEEKKKRQEETKQKIIQDYQKAKQQPFDFKTEKRPNNIEKVKQQVEQEIQGQLLFNKKYSKPVPNFNNVEAEVKLNAATILREEILLKKKNEVEKNRVEALEFNMRDSAEFDEWQKEMKEKDYLNQLEHQQRKKVEMELARDAAIKAQEEKFQQNKHFAEQMKQEIKEQMKEREELQKDQVEYRKKLIETVLENEKNVAIEREKIANRNKKAAEDAKLEKAQLLERKKLEDEQIRLKKEELIRQIRELEKQPRKRTKGYDPTETMGYGLLEEMSLAELKERLDQVKEEQKLEEENRRKENALKKDEYLSSLQKKVNDIKQHRQEQRSIKQLEKEQKQIKKDKEQQLKKEIREKQLLEVQQKIKTKKQRKQEEEEKIAKEVKETNLKQQYMNANKAMVEEKAWKSQQDGLEREIKERQNEKLINQERIESILNKEREILANAAKFTVKNNVELNKQYDKTLLQAQKANEYLFEEENANKKRNYEQERQWQMQHTKNMIERDQYKQKIANMSLENSKKQKTNIRSQSAKQNLKLPSAQYPKKEIEG